jgi:DtxR family Mn-dependent transcriptional regulator|tara:strand:- start:674 stop:1201 length:528 start_codon:yes stop_codon:yes gene_type:complete
MMKTLSESGLAEYQPYEGVQLTASGQALALRVIRRHRLIELFLVKTLDLTWDEVHEEAENMEHAVSDMLVDRIDEFLGRPDHDPHGDPIPKADGTVSTNDGELLASIKQGATVRLIRVLDQHPDFLRFLSGSGFGIGAEAVVAAGHEADSLRLKLNDNLVTISLAEAERLVVELV